MRRAGFAAACLIASFSVASADLRRSPDDRAAAISRAQVWMPTNIRAMNLMTGPTGPQSFPHRATVTCDFVAKELSGMSPKFACRIGRDDEVKVKYGGSNGEVYAEVAASRLLWALGFGADHMYPVRVVCRGCPREFNGTARGDGDREFVFDPAVIERKMSGHEIAAEWSWRELERVSEEAGGAPLAHRDALKLLAVFLQHTDSKPQQQRLICLDKGPAAGAAECARPFMLINDVGLTFGRASLFNENEPSGMNLTAWKKTPVWKDSTGCVGHLPKSFSGTLAYPAISEAGRRFLAGLLVQLTDAQIADLFTAARVTLRARTPGDATDGFATIEEWADAFRAKRAEIVSRRCA
jgi:hypothetical protein